jgi:hypothetical protein
MLALGREASTGSGPVSDEGVGAPHYTPLQREAIQRSFRTPYYLCGVAPYGTDLAVLRCGCVSSCAASVGATSLAACSSVMSRSKILRSPFMGCLPTHLSRKFVSSLAMLAWFVSASLLRGCLSSRLTLDFACSLSQDLSATVLPIRGHEDLSPADYKLVFGETHLADDGLPVLYILAPHDLIVAFPRGVLDHIDWCAERGEYEVRVPVSFQAVGYPS